MERYETGTTRTSFEATGFELRTPAMAWDSPGKSRRLKQPHVALARSSALGRKVHVPGPDPPVDDFGALHNGCDAHLTCISVGPGHDVEDPRRCVTPLEAMCDRSRPHDFGFGGPFASVRPLGTCLDLARRIESSSPRQEAR